MIYIENTELYHHGVKGQKWGVIRKRLKSAVTSGGRTVARSAIRGKKYIQHTLAKKKAIKSEVKTTRKKDPSKMSDDELRTANARLKLENKYIEEYNKRYPKKVSKSQKFIEDSLNKIGNAAVNSMTDYVKNIAKESSNNSNSDPSNKKNQKKKNNKTGNSKKTTRTDELNARIKNLA